MIYTNCDCLTQTKKVELENYVQLNYPDIIALSEVLPKNSIFDVNNEVFALQGYSLVCSDLTQGRGVILYIKDSIPAIDIDQDRNFQESTWCKINLSGGDNTCIIIGCVYRSSNSTHENNTFLFEALQVISGNDPSHLLILGDFNIKEIDWNNMSSAENENHIATQFLECIKDCFLFQDVREPTRYRSQNVPSILDLILTNESKLHYKPGLGKSDQLVLEFTYNCNIKSSESPPKKLNFFKGNYKNISEKLQENDWDQELHGLSLSEAWEILTEKHIKLIEENVPVRKVSNEAGRKNPYVSQQCMEAIRKKHTKWQKYLHNKTEENYTQYKAARNEVITELRRSKYDYEKDLATRIKTDNKRFWSYVRSKIKTKSNIGQLELPAGSSTNDNQEKAEILNNYFASVFAEEGPEALSGVEERNFVEPLTKIEINETKIIKSIDKLQASKSQGPDQIRPKLIKECKDSQIKPLRNIVQKINGKQSNSENMETW